MPTSVSIIDVNFHRNWLGKQSLHQHEKNDERIFIRDHASWCFVLISNILISFSFLWRIKSASDIFQFSHWTSAANIICLLINHFSSFLTRNLQSRKDFLALTWKLLSNQKQVVLCDFRDQCISLIVRERCFSGKLHGANFPIVCHFFLIRLTFSSHYRQTKSLMCVADLLSSL